MSVTRSAATLFLAAGVFATSMPAEALPKDLKAFAIIRSHSYEDGNHHASGTLRLVNTGANALTVNCRVTVTWERTNGSDTVKRNDKITDIRVGGGETRYLHFNVKLRDPDHLYDNIPTHAAPHCFLA